MKETWRSRIKLKQRFVLLTTTILIITLTPLAFLIYNYQKNYILRTSNQQMENHLQDMTNLLDLQLKEKQAQVASALEVARYLFSEKGQLQIETTQRLVTATNQLTKETKQVTLSQWIVNDTVVHGNYGIVDKIQELTGQTATIFQKIDDGYLRISTNVRKLDGERATGTYIPNSSSVIKTIEQGQTYQGRAFVVNDWYLTAYEPIIHEGEIIGILYVGVKEKDLSFLREKFYAKQFLSSGYPYLVTQEGNLIIHPTQEGENIGDIACLNIGKEVSIITCHWGGKDQEEMLHYIANHTFFNMALGIAIPKAELVDAPLNTLGGIIFGGFFGTILILFLLLNVFIGRQVAPLTIITDQLHKLGNREAITPLVMDREDEIGIINESVNKVIESQGQITAFARAVGEKKFDAQFEAMGTNDQLGHSLLYMRQSLKEAAKEDAQRSWISEGHNTITTTIRNNQQSIVQLSTTVLPVIIKYIDACQGGLFVYHEENDEKFLELTATYAWNRQKAIQKKIPLNEPTSQGVIGQVFFEKESILMTEVPENYVEIHSGLGKANPKYIVVLPLIYNEQVYGILELAAFKPIDAKALAYLEETSESMAATIASLKITESTSKLLEETQEKTGAISAMEEELRQNLEEMQATQESMQRKEKEYLDHIEKLESELGRAFPKN